MNILTNSRFLAFSFLLCSFPIAHAQGQDQGMQALLGSWVGVSAEVQGERVVIEKNSATIEGDRVPLHFVSPGLFVLKVGDKQVQVRYVLKGQRLSLDVSGERSEWQRLPAARGKPQPSKENPADQSLGGASENPFGAPKNGAPKQAPANPFVRSFEGQGVFLRLSEGAKGLLVGELRFRGQKYPVQAKAKGTSLEGVFQAGKSRFPFQAKLAGDSLTFTSGGRSYKLKGEKLVQKQPSNPLGGDGGEGQCPDSDKAEEGKDSRVPEGCRLFVHKKAGVACYLPKDWTLLQGNAEGVAINPGYQNGERILCTIGLGGGPAPLSAKGKTIEDILKGELAGFTSSLAESGIKVDLSAKRLKSLTVRGEPAAAIEAPAQTAAGQKGKVWLGIRRDDGRILACSAVYLLGAEEKFAEKVHSVFVSLRPAAKAAEMGR
ncbi:MAG: hypothetical protein CSA62_08525 [Planctomycetota bacterium]|nr:MAG: hypothetical protein CSA62_08525 [Planctomycetota bacterium]